MKNLLPDTFAVRAMLLLVVGLAFTHLVSNLFYATDRESALLTSGGEHAIQWVATTGAFADTLPSGNWPGIIKSANSDHRFVTISPDPIVTKASGSDWREVALQQELSRHVPAKRLQDYRIAYVPYGMETKAGAYWHAALSRFGQEMPDELVVVSLRLKNGSWLNVASPIQSPPLFFSARLGWSMVVMLVAVVAISALIVGRMTEPLKQLSMAAEKLGTDVQAPAIPETGPEEVRRTAHAFNVMQNRIRRFVEDRTQMLGAIAHDLGTPITRLRLRAEFVEDEDVRSKMLRDLDDMQHMVASTLSFIREDATSEPQVMVDLGSLLARVCDDIIDAGEDVDLAEIPRWVLVDCRPIALRRALGNLVGNAVKYGSIARVSLKIETDRLAILIDDDGPGIPEARQEDVFQPFRRLEDSRNRETGGTGLGLAVARTIVRAHGGDIQLSNPSAGGLRVTVCLPRPKNALKGAATTAAPDVTGGADMAHTEPGTTTEPAGSDSGNNETKEVHANATSRNLPINSSIKSCLPKGRYTEWKTL